MTKSSAGIQRPRCRLCQLSVRRARFLPAPKCPQPSQAQFTASHGRHHHQPRLPDCLSPSPRGHCRASQTLQAGDHLRSPQAPQPPCRGPAGGTWPGPPRWSEAGRPPPSQPSPATPAPADTAQPLALPSRLHSRRRRTASTRTPEPPPTAPSRRPHSRHTLRGRARSHRQSSIAGADPAPCRRPHALGAATAGGSGRGDTRSTPAGAGSGLPRRRRHELRSVLRPPEREVEKGCPAAAVLAGRTDFCRPAQAVARRTGWREEGGVAAAAAGPPGSPPWERRGGRGV